jgi:Tfp pilus assembly protein PilN
MLAINLIPDAIKPSEGTPSGRLAVLVSSVVLTCGLIVLNAKFYSVDIPMEQTEIKTCDEQIADLNQRMNEVHRIDQEIAALKQRVAVLANVEAGRMRYGRLLDRLCNCMPKGVWFTSFTVTADPKHSDFYPQPLGGKRYQIALSGWAVGDTQLESGNRLTELMSNMRKQFGIPEDAQFAKTIASGTATANVGFNKDLGARFDPPSLSGTTISQLPATQDPKKDKPPAVAETFRMHFSFEMPATQN